ncbi:hypothetical protein GCM10010435_44670 [Winogradskya consettensis]|uniref:Uncharacterized protein n=1 Tax=Winogradskya consettensis TaxID=113560 RepID=A0A919T020_9ACTN|nr:hypothetical protein [Actinoplanes consettensis]GIM82746.1 hypothetical protein Aco04nite_83060 [Actinoplanes consettensis]
MQPENPIEIPSAGAVPAEDIEFWITVDGVDLVQRGSGRVLIRIPRAEVPAFMRQLGDAHGGAILAVVTDRQEQP